MLKIRTCLAAALIAGGFPLAVASEPPVPPPPAAEGCLRPLARLISQVVDPLLVRGDAIAITPGHFEIHRYDGGGRRPQRMLRAYRELWAPGQEPLDYFGGTTWKRYEGKYPPALVATIQQVDRSIEPRRTAVATVWADGEAGATGVIRVFDGSRRPEIKGDPRMPVERMLALRGTEIPELEALRATAPHLFEIGKFNVQDGLSAGAHEQTRGTLEYWLLQRFVAAYPDATYVIHVASPKLRDAFMRNYGFTLLKEVRPADAAEPEFVLVAPQAPLAARLRERVKDYRLK